MPRASNVKFGHEEDRKAGGISGINNMTAISGSCVDVLERAGGKADVFTRGLSGNCHSIWIRECALYQTGRPWTHDVAMSRNKQTAFAIVEYLQKSISDGIVREDDKESLETASECLTLVCAPFAVA